MSEKRFYLTPKQAMSVLDKNYHTFVQEGNFLLGCDGSKQYMKDLLNRAEIIEIAGEEARKISHGVAIIMNKRSCYFAKTVESKLKKLEEQLSK